MGGGMPLGGDPFVSGVLEAVLGGGFLHPLPGGGFAPGGPFVVPVPDDGGPPGAAEQAWLDRLMSQVGGHRGVVVDGEAWCCRDWGGRAGWLGALQRLGLGWSAPLLTSTTLTLYHHTLDTSSDLLPLPIQIMNEYQPASQAASQRAVRSLPTLRVRAASAEGEPGEGQAIARAGEPCSVW